MAIKHNGIHAAFSSVTKLLIIRSLEWQLITLESVMFLMSAYTIFLAIVRKSILGWVEFWCDVSYLFFKMLCLSLHFRNTGIKMTRTSEGVTVTCFSYILGYSFFFFFLLSKSFTDDVTFLRARQIRNASQQKPNTMIYTSYSKCLWVLCFHNSLHENTVRIIR